MIVQVTITAPSKILPLLPPSLVNASQPYLCPVVKVLCAQSLSLVLNKTVLNVDIFSVAVNSIPLRLMLDLFAEYVWNFSHKARADSVLVITSVPLEDAPIVSALTMIEVQLVLLAATTLIVVVS
jgi:hypothetical protein